MSTFELNKIVGAILSVALVAMVIGMIGDSLVEPRTHEGAVATGGGAKAPAQQKEPEKPEPIAPLLAKASADKGQAATTPCKSCHTFEKGGKNGVGPNLWNTVMNNKGHAQGFSYSSGMKEKGGKWTYEDLSAFLHKPQAFIKGTKMAFPGIPEAQKRADVIAYLRSLSENPPPLPKAEEAPAGQQGGQQQGQAPQGGQPQQGQAPQGGQPQQGQPQQGGQR